VRRQTSLHCYGVKGGRFVNLRAAEATPPTLWDQIWHQTHTESKHQSRSCK